ncbi:desulfoferrodoxin family protein [Candidatus Omnitrophota bacterium]
METFVCKVCGHIEFTQAPEKCPVCGAGKAAFESKSDAIKQPVDSVNLTEAEKKHIPKIVVVKTCGLIPGGHCVDVHVKVGEIEHVMQSEHYITWIDFYVDKQYVSRAMLTPEKLHPAAALHLNVGSGTLTAIEHCNVHGNWLAEANL